MSRNILYTKCIRNISCDKNIKIKNVIKCIFQYDNKLIINIILYYLYNNIIYIIIISIIIFICIKISRLY